MEPIRLNETEKHVEGVSCNVNNCVYHREDHRCSAQAVHVGPSYAVKSTDTICGTFRNKNR